MSPRPGRIIDEIRIDMPHRDDPIARRADKRLGDYAARLMHRLHIGEAAAVEPAA
jgi:NitT/TauT family transport system ATP-binding protein